MAVPDFRTMGPAQKKQMVEAYLEWAANPKLRQMVNQAMEKAFPLSPQGESTFITRVKSDGSGAEISIVDIRSSITSFRSIANTSSKR
jgi:hypothetical protein